MILLKHKMAFLGYIEGDKSCEADTQRYHEKLKGESKDYLSSDIGMCIDALLHKDRKEIPESIIHHLKVRALKVLMKG